MGQLMSHDHSFGVIHSSSLPYHRRTERFVESLTMKNKSRCEGAITLGRTNHSACAKLGDADLWARLSLVKHWPKHHQYHLIIISMLLLPLNTHKFSGMLRRGADA